MDDYSNQIMQGGAMVSSSLDNLNNMIMTKNENEKNRKFNSEEAQKQRDYNTFLYNNETQMKVRDARQAGLNPAFMNGSVLSSNPSATSPASSSVGTVAPLQPGAGYSSLAMLAQARNLDAGADKLQADANRTRIETDFLPALMQSTIDFNLENIRLTGQNVKLSKEQALNLSQNTLNLEAELRRCNAQIDMYRSQIANVDADTLYKRIANYFASDKFKAEIKNLQAQAGWSFEQARDLVATRSLRLLNLDQNNKYLQALGIQAEESADFIQVQNDKLTFDLKLDKKYKKTERVINMGSTVLGAITGSCKNICGSAASLTVAGM